ncbi:MAG: nucleotide sugar dehydrogenase [Candidatus Competibacteraceae bacterium]|nr:nucleotide sugar dehydrogenase [Candidatus Competibacteraceae bacterium]
MKITIFGSGYVGLVTGACFAEVGNDVLCVDVDPHKVAMLQRGEIPIHEPGLDDVVRRNGASGRLRFTTEVAEGVAHGLFQFIAVGTPPDEDGSADLQHVRAVARSIGQYVQDYRVVIDKSTVPVGTADIVRETIAGVLAERGQDIPFSVVSNPEFLKEGAAVADFMRPDRIIVGNDDHRATVLLRNLYAPFNRNHDRLIEMDVRSAELTKYAANAMLATKISFMNEIANLAERLGADIEKVRIGIGADPRIGYHFIYPGAGYGGSCFEAEETVFTLNSPNVAAEKLETVFNQGGEPFQSETVAVVTPRNKRVLAFDLETGQPTLAQVQAVTRRPYQGLMVRIKTSMGRRLSVTADHPVILRAESGFNIVPAVGVAPGDQLMALCELPTVEPAASLDLIERLRGTPLAQGVHVAPLDDAFSARYQEFAAHIPASVLRHPEEIRRHNRMPLRLYWHLRQLGVLDIPAEQLQLYTAKGAGTRINACIPVDADLLRLCGYYLAEGYISQDVGRAGAVRERIGFCFHAKEAEYIVDVQRILSRWGLKFLERHGQNALTTVVSSRIMAWLLRDVLRCGVRSEDKALPRLAFNVPSELRMELIRGAFSGDGSVTPVQNRRNLMLEYATVSQSLAHGLALLLQTVGVIPAIRQRWMNKSTQPAYILRVSGYAQLERLQDVFGDQRRAQIETVLAGYQRQIKQRGFSRLGAYAALTVQEVTYEDVETTVYSLETSTGTVIAASGLICHNCFPKDVKALEYTARSVNYEAALLQAVETVNERQKTVLFAKIQRHFHNELRGRTFALWGLAFKPGTDDMREAPSRVLLEALWREGAAVRAYDPAAMNEARRLYGERPDFQLCNRPSDTLNGADALVIMTEWSLFRSPDFDAIHQALKQPVIFDGRNLYDPEYLREQGFVYYAIGRGETA